MNDRAREQTLQAADYPKPGKWVRIAGFATALLAAGCGSEPPPPAIEVAGIGVAEAAIARLGAVERQNLVDLIALGAAIAREETEDLGRPVLERAAMESLVAALPYALAAESMGWTEQDLRSAYAEQPEWELVVRHLVRLAEPGDPPEQHAEARALAEEAARRAAAGEDFGALAAEYSEEPGAAERGGLLEPGRRGTWVDAFWNAASPLAVGQITGVVESPYGYHVIRLEDRRTVDFEEASRTALLGRVVPAAAARAAAEAWAAGDGSVSVDAEAAIQARDRILSGQEVPPEPAIARGNNGETYDGHHLAAGWGLLSAASRTPLEASEPGPFLDWVRDDARIVVWGMAAEHRGLDLPDAALATARSNWFVRVGGWAGALGFRPGMPDEQVLALARDAVLSGAPEVRAARLDVRSLRPRLREIYPVTGEF